MIVRDPRCLLNPVADISYKRLRSADHVQRQDGHLGLPITQHECPDVERVDDGTVGHPLGPIDHGWIGRDVRSGRTRRERGYRRR